jgi:hypothetical protein
MCEELLPSSPQAIGDNGGPPLPESGPTLVPYYEVYAPARFPSAKTKRAQQNIARKLRLPLIKAGHSTLIDPQMGDDRLRELAQFQMKPERRRGRPRVVIT